MSVFSLTILGCNSAVPAFDRFPTSQLLKYKNESILIDCGEGTQFQFSKFKIKRANLNYIFISHLHGDHYFGLVGLLNSFRLGGREAPLHIYGPPELEQIIQLQADYTREDWLYPVYFHAHNYGKSYKIAETKYLEVFTIPLEHRIPCNGFLFVEKPKPKKINAEALLKYSVPNTFIPKLRIGKDFVNDKGEIIKNELLTFEPEVCKKYAYCSDTVYNEAIIPIIKDADLLYHEATYLSSEEDKAEKWNHSTAKQAALIAKKANVGKLILGHYSAKYHDIRPFQAEAKEVFENTELAVDGKEFEV
ncbi:MAG: ribonuclease Z [Chitinophagales bacterium]